MNLKVDKKTSKISNFQEILILIHLFSELSLQTLSLSSDKLFKSLSQLFTVTGSISCSSINLLKNSSPELGNDRLQKMNSK